MIFLNTAFELNASLKNLIGEFHCTSSMITNSMKQGMTCEAN